MFFWLFFCVGLLAFFHFFKETYFDGKRLVSLTAVAYSKFIELDESKHKVCATLGTINQSVG